MKFDKYLLVVLVVFFLFEFISAPLRYVLLLIGIPHLIYLPKLLMFFAVVYKCLTLLNGYASRAFLFYFPVGVYLSLVTLIYGSIYAAILTIFYMIPLLFGSISGHVFFNALRTRRFKVFLFLLIVISLISCVADVYIGFPWDGFVYELAGKEVEGSRDWSSAGIERVSGFFRLSLIAASSVTIVCYSLIPFTSSLILRLFLLIVPCIISLLSISKSVLICNLLFIAYCLLYWIPIRVRWFGILSISILLSVLTYNLIGYYVDLNSPSETFLLGSFAERLSKTWPDVLNVVQKGGGAWIGSGVGAVGPASKINSDVGHYIVGDSFYLYMLGAGGISLMVFSFFWLSYMGLYLKNLDMHNAIVGSFMVMMVCGFAMSILDYPVFALFFGFLFCVRVFIPRYQMIHRKSPISSGIA